jgi:hypothetical protein
MLCKELFNFQNKLFYIDRRVRESHISQDSINELKSIWKIDTVVRQNSKNTNEGFYLFLKEIKDAEIVG